MRGAISRVARVAAFALVGVGIVAASPLSPTQAESISSADIDSFRPSRLPCFYDNATWAQLTIGEQRAWAVLGWSQALWDAEDAEDAGDAEDADVGPVSEDKTWRELSDDERVALTSLGYQEASWNNGMSCADTGDVTAENAAEDL